MEWLEQTKRLAKEEDYMGLAIVDNVEENIALIQPELLRRNRDFFYALCDDYHKPNPTRYLKEKIPRSNLPKSIKPVCLKFVRRITSDQLQIQIDRFRQAQKVILWQWFEVIDFMYERPELVNPALIDEYITDKINDVCLEHKKSNPLSNGMLARFGKYWKDEKGRWQKERRNRF